MCGSTGIAFMVMVRLALDYMERLFDAGVKGKRWRLIRSFYVNAKCRVRAGDALSKSCVLERGVKQGSILSPHNMTS